MHTCICCVGLLGFFTLSLQMLLTWFSVYQQTLGTTTDFSITPLTTSEYMLTVVMATFTGSLGCRNLPCFSSDYSSHSFFMYHMYHLICFLFIFSATYSGNGIQNYDTPEDFSTSIKLPVSRCLCIDLK